RPGRRRDDRVPRRRGEPARWPRPGPAGHARGPAAHRGATVRRMKLRLAGGSGLLLVAVLVFAANLRGPIAALGPVVGDVATELALTPAAVGILSGLPVLCFALAAPLASGFIGRFGVGRTVTRSLLLIIAGTVLRSWAGFPTAVLGTLLLGVAITAGNIAVPV